MNSHLLSDLDERECAALLARTTLVEVVAGDYLVREGDSERWLGILRSGRAQVVITNPRGRRFVLDTLEPGACFGELALVLGVPRNASVTAQRDCEFYKLPAEAYAAHRAEWRGIERALLQAIARRLFQTTQHAAQLVLLDTTSRVLTFLRSTAHRVETPNGIRLRVEIPPHHECAALLGTTREMVSRALKLLEESGEIERSGKAAFLHAGAEDRAAD